MTKLHFHGVEILQQPLVYVRHWTTISDGGLWEAIVETPLTLAYSGADYRLSPTGNLSILIHLRPYR
jgi:hypothetical protein